MTMGYDYGYQNAHKKFKNLDKLIKYVNAKVRLSSVLYTNLAYVLFCVVLFPRVFSCLFAVIKLYNESHHDDNGW